MLKEEDKEDNIHISVLLTEVIKGLNIKKLALLKRRLRFIDATLGLGGHTAEIVKLGGNVLGIEADYESLKLAEGKIRLSCPTPEEENSRGSYTLVHGNFRHIDTIAKDHGFYPVDGILLDLGISSYQLGVLERGFSFKNSSSPLDMRMDPENQKITAADLLTILSKDQLVDLFAVTLDYVGARSLAQKIIVSRSSNRFATVGDFLALIGGKGHFTKGLHPGTLPFLALRIAVNSELANLEEVLPKAFSLLKSGGRLLVISFHSGEDALVKSFFILKEKNNQAVILTKKPILPGQAEIEFNPRARSAKLRILQKYENPVTHDKETKQED